MFSSNRKAAGSQNLKPQKNVWKTIRRCSGKLRAAMALLLHADFPRIAVAQSKAALKWLAVLIVAFTTATAAEHSAITTVVGTGVKGFSGDGGHATKAQLSSPMGIARGPDNALYICDSENHR